MKVLSCKMLLFPCGEIHCFIEQEVRVMPDWGVFAGCQRGVCNFVFHQAVRVVEITT